MSLPKNASDMLVLPTNPPHQVWLAENGDIPALVDPDTARRPRWPDRDTLNWKAIGDAVESAGRRLIAGEFSIDESGAYSVTINLEPYRFSAAEAETVASWFGIAGPHSDPGITKPTDGRHRLWNVWKHNPRALLPINSDALTSSSSSTAFTILRFPRFAFSTATPTTATHSERQQREPRTTSQQADLTAELAQAARALSEIELIRSHLADTQALLPNLRTAIDSLKQVSAQLSWWYSRSIRGIDYVADVGAGTAVEDAAAQLLAASRFLSAARDAVGAAEEATGEVRWKRRHSTPTSHTDQ